MRIVFLKACTMPTKYLPKKKRLKLEASGKLKLPAASTSDAWLRMQLEEEEKKGKKKKRSLKKKNSKNKEKATGRRKKEIGCKNERREKKSR